MAGTRQIKILRFLEQHRIENGLLPTSSEFNDRMGLGNRPMAVAMLMRLERSGYIERRGRAFNTAKITTRGHAALKQKIPVAPEGPAMLFTQKVVPSTATGTAFPKSVVGAGDAGAVLTPGINSAKLGPKVTKTSWRGMPIFYLTLEERATCPRACANWTTCYGNNMPFAKRIRPGLDLLVSLNRELGRLQKVYPSGFVVRLHMLGDFYSVDYVNQWGGWMRDFPALHVFGYTAHDQASPIGSIVAAFNWRWNTRWAVRFSGGHGPMTAQTLDRLPAKVDQPEGLVCPHQLGHVPTCGACGLCWTSDRPILFVEHALLPRKL